jgi:hypothetical protein
MLGDEYALQSRVADPDPLYFGKPDPDPRRIKRWLDPDLHQSWNSWAVEAQNGAIKGRGWSQWRRGGSKWSPERSTDHWSQIGITSMRSRVRIWIPIRIEVTRRIRIRILEKSGIRLKVQRKIENFFDSDFGICVISLLVTVYQNIKILQQKFLIGPL